MRYVLTKHAQERIRERKISIQEVIKTIEDASLKELEDEQENKIAFYRKLTNKLILKVVAIKSNEIMRIITVYPVDEKRLKKVKSLIELS